MISFVVGFILGIVATLGFIVYTIYVDEKKNPTDTT